MKAWLVRLAALACIAALAFWGWRILFPNPERVIRQRMQELAVLASFAPNEAPLAKLMNSQNIGSYLAGNVEAVVDVPGRSQQTFSGRDEIVGAATAARNNLASLTVEFVDLTVTLAPDKQSASANFTLKARVSGERDWYVDEMKATWRKVDGKWVISRVETVKTLSSVEPRIVFSHARGGLAGASI